MAVKMTVCFSETLVSIYESTQRHNPENIIILKLISLIFSVFVFFSF
jgi:hypothetical protein